MLAALFTLCSFYAPIEAEVSFLGVGGLQLKGTLTMPEKAVKKMPAVLLLPGSGPTDRNGNQPPYLVTDLLKQISERLAKEGIASLRFDKRATPGYAAKFPKDVPAQNEFFSWESFVGDAKAALVFLKGQPGIDAKRTAIAGHSEGGLIAACIGHEFAGKSEGPKVLVLIGTAGRTLDVVIREQVAANLSRANLSEQLKKPMLDYMELAFKELKEKGTIPPNAPPAMAPLFPPSAAKLLRSYFTVDPAKVAADFSGPVLIVQGEKDIQVSAKRDAPLLLAALKARKKGSCELFIVPSASHNLKTVGDENKEPGLTGPAAQSALDKIASWLKTNLK